MRKDERFDCVAQCCLRLAQSGIPGAGLGVLARCPLPVGLAIGVYGGELLAERPGCPRRAAYTLQLEDGAILDGPRAEGARAWPPRINSVRGTGRRASVRFVDTLVVMQSVLEPGEELLVSYGGRGGWYV